MPISMLYLTKKMKIEFLIEALRMRAIPIMVPDQHGGITYNRLSAIASASSDAISANITLRYHRLKVVRTHGMMRSVCIGT